MRILFFVSSMHAGGAERVAATLASAWARRGDDVTLVPSYTKKGDCFYALDPAVELLWLADRMGKRSGPLSSLIKKQRAMRRLVREKRPDVIVSFLTNVNITVLASTAALGVPTIVCERTNPAASSSAGPVLKRLRRLLYPWADLVAVQTQDSVSAFKKMVPGIRDLVVIPNPLPPELLAPHDGATLAARCRLDNGVSGRKRLIAMGRLVPAKGYESLIRAFADLAAHHADWDLVIWGEGPLRAALTAQIGAAGLSDRVFLPGRTDAPWEKLACADVFVLSSLVEGFPNVLLEAMALERACVAVDCPSGPREISRDGADALLVPLGDAQALTQSLDALMGDPERRAQLGKRAAQSVRERFALNEVLALWDEMLKRAIKSRNKGKA